MGLIYFLINISFLKSNVYKVCYEDFIPTSLGMMEEGERRS